MQATLAALGHRPLAASKAPTRSAGARVPPLARAARPRVVRPRAAAADGAGPDFEAAYGQRWAYPNGSSGCLLWSPRPAEKTSINSPTLPGQGGANDTTTPNTMRFAELVHWVFFVPPMLLSFALLAKGAATPLQLWCFTAFPIFQALGALAPFAVHESEGWQFAPFQSPDKSEPNFLEKYNNQWTRQTMYRFLIIMQAAGLILFNLGVFGTASPTYAYLAIATTLAFVFGPKTALNIDIPWAPKGSYPVPFPNLVISLGFLLHSIVSFWAWALATGVDGELLKIAAAAHIPGGAVGASIVIGFVGLAVTAVTVTAALYRPAYKMPAPWRQLVIPVIGYALPALLVAAHGFAAAAPNPALARALLFWIPTALVTIGGLFEALFAEILSDQVVHAAGVVWFCAGFVAMQLWLTGTYAF